MLPFIFFLRTNLFQQYQQHLSFLVQRNGKAGSNKYRIVLQELVKRNGTPAAQARSAQRACKKLDTTFQWTTVIIFHVLAGCQEWLHVLSAAWKSLRMLFLLVKCFCVWSFHLVVPRSRTFPLCVPPVVGYNAYANFV
jgi:hypothetical protein